MSSQPLITTVIPTYQRPNMLRRAIRSVLDQTYPHFKICVYDNASNDETGEVVSAMASRDSRIRYHRHPTNIGAQDNFIFGLSQVDTPLVHLISDDDFLLPGFFAQATSALNKHPSVAFFSGGMLSADPDGRVRALVCYGSKADQVYRPAQLFQLLAPYTRTWTSAIFRRTALEAVGGLKKETGYSFSIDLILRLATRVEAVLSDAPCAVFTVHPGSSSVAGACEAFESLLTLGFFESVNEAIDSARKDKLVTDHDAAGMKSLFRATTEWVLFRGAFGMIARGQRPVALRASRVLAESFDQKAMAAMIRVATMDHKIGSPFRLALSTVRSARGLWFGKAKCSRYSVYSEVVRDRMLQLV
ncbi:MAG: glycosyltransferase family 2 protein [Candidatus Binataceae bacterium]|jgi:glycosyltransferase involved in cell wall biosynthesis